MLRKLNICSVALVFVSSLSVYGANKLAIADWKLNEGKGQVIVDSSGNRKNGTFEGKWVKGDFGTAILLKNNFITFSAKTTPQIAKSSFTITAWILPKKLEYKGKQKTIRVLSAFGPDSFFVIDLEDGGKPQLEMGIKVKGKWTYCRVTSKSKIILNKWSKITLICDRVKMAMEVYINDSKEGEDSLPAVFKNEITGYKFTLGSIWHGFQGLISGVKIFNHARSDKDIKEDYSQEKTNKANSTFKILKGVSQASSAKKKKIQLPVDKSKFGSKISRTMTALATSTPSNKKSVRLLFYGQSIIGQPWTHAIGRRLQNKYPNANLTFENRSIGGFEANRLVRTANNDLYPYYPDFVIFHDYGGNKGEFEAMIANLRKKTSAEILLTTHHISHHGNNWVQNEYDKQSQRIRELASKYDCEFVDIRNEWRQHLKKNGLKTNDLLRDTVHLNKKGCKLMEELVWRHLRYNKKFSNPHSKWIKTIAVKPAKNGSIKIKFNGNRIDLISAKTNKPLGTARILIDNKPPSANLMAYAVTRASNAIKAWWPAILNISFKNKPLIEDWVLTVTEISDQGKNFKFKVTGSKTGPDGTGKSGEKFISKSGRVVIDPKDFFLGKKCPVGFKVKWSIVPMFKDIYTPSEKQTTVVQLIENGPHTIEIIPNGDGTVPVKEIVVYQPPLK